MADLAPILDDLRTLASQGKVFAGQVGMNEEEFYILAVKLKKALPQAFANAPAPLPPGALVAIRAVDDLERVVQNGKHILGKVLVNKAAYLSEIEKIAAALPDASSESGSMKTWT